MSISNPRRHETDPLEGEIRWAPHIRDGQTAEEAGEGRSLL